MKSKKENRAGLALLKNGFALLLLCMLQQSCKKADSILSVAEKEQAAVAQNTNITQQFFTLPANANSAVRRVANELQNRNNKKEFIISFAKAEGFAVWDKAAVSISKRKMRHSSLESENDTTVIVPLVRQDSLHVQGFLLAHVADTVSIEHYRDRDYQLLPYNGSASAAQSNITTAENFALRMMQMEREVFGYKEFDIQDRRLFAENDNIPDTVKVKRIVSFDTTNTNDFNAVPSTTNLVHLVCVTIYVTEGEESFRQTKTGFGTGKNNQNSFSYPTPIRICVSWNDNEGDESWPVFPPGTGGSGGSPGNGNNPPCAPTSDEMVQNSMPVGCQPIPNPWPPVIPSIFSNLDNPIDVPDDIVEESYIKITSAEPPATPPIRRIGKINPRGNTEDMTYGNNCDMTGIMSNLGSFTDAELFSSMNSLINTCAIFDADLRSVGEAMSQKFKNKTGGTFTDATLSQKVFNSSAFQTFIVKYGELLNQALANANWNINNVGEIDIDNRIRPTFNGLYNKFHGLQILINDTEETEIFLHDFTIHPVTHKWTATISISIKDHFGLDKHDALAYQNKHPGFAAWWILQHCRGYKPFETNIKISMNLVSVPK